MLVSVVVPVWNPGHYLDRCVRSLLAQTVDLHDIELIFVNDGSTDGTDKRLDELAATHPQISVIHEPGSGWAGRPRNVGIDAATGRWVQFVDQDDTMAPDALRQLTALGDASGADIVVGKVTSNFRPLNQELFRENRTDATLLNSPLSTSLTPHKMFRREFLVDHQLRFPEGKRRLEDQVFMVEAYLAAENTAILASYNCYSYLHRDDGGNAGAGGLEPVGYYRDLEEALDALDRGSEPGPVRDLMMRRFLRSEILGKVVGQAALNRTPEARQATWAVTRDLLERRFSYLRNDDRVSATDRLATELLLAGDEAGLLDLSTRRSGIRGAGSVSEMTWSDDAWTVRLRVELTHSDGQPVEVVRGSSGEWTLDPRVIPAAYRTKSYSVETDLTVVDGLTMLVRRGSRLTWCVPTEWSTTVTPTDDPSRARVVLTGVAVLRPQGSENAAGLRAGIWELRVRVRSCGLAARPWLTLDMPVPPPALLPGPKVVTIADRADRRVALDVGQVRTSVTEAVARHGFGTAGIDPSGRITIPVTAVAGKQKATITVVARLGEKQDSYPPVKAVYDASPTAARLVIEPLTGAEQPASGDWPLTISSHDMDTTIGIVRLVRHRVIKVVIGEATDDSAVERLGSYASRGIAAARRQLKRRPR